MQHTCSPSFRGKGLGFRKDTPIVKRVMPPTTIATNPLTRAYDTGGFYDEMFAPGTGGQVVPSW